MNRIIGILFTITLVVLFLFLYSCNGNAESKTTKENEVVAVPVEIGNVEVGNVAAVFSGTANLEAEGEATVVAKVSGVVRKIYVEEGMNVKEGQILAKLDDEQLIFRLNQARADLNKLKNEFKRSEELFAKNLISADAFDKVKYDNESKK